MQTTTLGTSLLFQTKVNSSSTQNHQRESIILGDLAPSVRMCGCADSPQLQHSSDFPKFPHPHIRTLEENAIGGMAVGGIFGIPSKNRLLECFRLPPIRHLRGYMSKTNPEFGLQNFSCFVLKYSQLWEFVRIPNSEFYFLVCKKRF